MTLILLPIMPFMESGSKMIFFVSITVFIISCFAPLITDGFIYISPASGWRSTTPIWSTPNRTPYSSGPGSIDSNAERRRLFQQQSDKSPKFFNKPPGKTSSPYSNDDKSKQLEKILIACRTLKNGISITEVHCTLICI